MRHLFHCLLVGLVAMLFAPSTQAQDQLVVFVQPGRSISQDFLRTGLAGVESIAQRHNLPLKVVDATQGAPAEVTQTPAIFLKKNDKYTPFAGRYRDFDQLSDFVVAGGTHQTNLQIGDRPTMAWRAGRTTLAAHFDVAPLAGKLPSKLDETEFEQRAEALLADGMNYLKPASVEELSTSPRSFFMEFRPEHTDDDLLLINMSLYSAFDLENPVFVTTVPSGSEWDEWETAFGKAGQRLEAMLIAQISSNENGDGFEPMKSHVPVKPWNALVEVPTSSPALGHVGGVGR